MASPETDYLLRLAGYSLSFVGFSSIVVSLRGALGGKLSDRHLRLVRLYIEGGLLVTVLALVPTLLDLLRVPGSVAWPLSSGLAAAAFTIVLVIQFRRRRKIEPGSFPRWVIIVYLTSIVAVAALWLNVIGIPLVSRGGPYAIALTWSLCVFGFIFLRTLEMFLQSEPDA